ncbi:MAG: TauD/TfdA family dioxygenase, partial [Pseudomonadota bacterium]
MPVAVTFDPEYLHIKGDIDATIPCAWLLDNRPDTRDAGTGQFLRDLSTHDLDSTITDAALCGEQIIVTFHDDTKIAYPTALIYDQREPAPSPTHFWQKKITVQSAKFSDLCDNLPYDWLQALHNDGCALVTNAPTHAGAVCEIGALLGLVHETNYGRYFDVKSQIDPINLAYTGLALSPHTDNPYREPVPAYQILLCVESTTDGGDSILVDGFAHAINLRNEDPHAFSLLSETPVTFSFTGDANESLHMTRPVIQLGIKGEITAVHVNERARQPLPTTTPKGFYQAYKGFLQRLSDAQHQTHLRLQSKEAYIVNNRRILHGRTSFSSGGNRHLQ